MSGLTNRQQLLRQIDALSFSIIDLTQFIDTHPYHTEAILKLQQYNTEKTNLVNQYSSMYGPLSANEITETNYALYQKAPMPWKGDCY